MLLSPLARRPLLDGLAPAAAMRVTPPCYRAASAVAGLAEPPESHLDQPAVHLIELPAS